MSEDLRAGELDLPASIGDGKVVEGRDGRLFLANDANEVLDQHSGRLRFTEDQLRQWRLLLETRIAWLERRGARHYFLIAPNGHSVYADMLPVGIPSASERPIHQLLGHLRDHESYARILYPLDSLVAIGEAAYPKTGSHWSPYGASVASQALVEEIRRDVPVDGVSPDAFEFAEITIVGDLGAKMNPQRTSTFVRADGLAPRAQLVFDNRVVNKGRRVVYEWESADTGPHCMVYGDSFALRAVRFLAESFARVTFVQMVNLDFDLVRKLEPDVVVKVMNERFMIVVPQDLPAKTQAQLEAEKIAAGEVMPMPRAQAAAGRGPAPPA